MVGVLVAGCGRVGYGPSTVGDAGDAQTPALDGNAREAETLDAFDARELERTEGDARDDDRAFDALELEHPRIDAPSDARFDVPSDAPSDAAPDGLDARDEDTGPACPAPMLRCGASCIDPSADLANCGACGRACASVAPNAQGTCVAGRCALRCDLGFFDCDANPENGCEVDGRTDANHCGACETACRATLPNTSSACVMGTCTPRCTAGHANCTGDLATRGCDVDLSSPLSCGACGVVCPAATPLCTAAGEGHACTAACTAGLSLCPGAFGGLSCVDEQRDPLNCGDCGNRCTPGGVCTAGVCGCPAGMDNCGAGAACVDVLANTSHCGACRHSCNGRSNVAMASCVAGACNLVCAGGFGNCDRLEANGCEAPLDTDEHCGSCGTACALPFRCREGSCQCGEGMQLCGGTCVEINDPRHCGACDAPCDPPSAYCQRLSTTAAMCTVCPTGTQNCRANTCSSTLDDPDNCGECGHVCATGTCVGGFCAP